MQAVGQNRRAAHPNWHGVDLFVDGEYWRSLMATDRVQDFEFFSDRDHRVREITLYLPLYDEIEIAAIGCDDSAIFELVSSYNHPLPLVFYGSSIVQGSGAGRPSQTYAALVARKTNLDFINLGFGGAGRGEPVVVDLVNQLRACCFVLDLGKSYDFQPPDVYINMLASIRNAHPATPIISVTSITSSRELYYDDEFKAVSEHTRRVIGEATRYCQEHGDDNLYLVNGSDLIATTQMDAFYEGVHPNILGTTLIAEPLVTLVQRCVRQTGAAND
jgi:hypothetical protein